MRVQRTSLQPEGRQHVFICQCWLVVSLLLCKEGGAADIWLYAMILLIFDLHISFLSQLHRLFPRYAPFRSSISYLRVIVSSEVTFKAAAQNCGFVHKLIFCCWLNVKK